MTKPQGYRQSAAEAVVYILPLCLPYYQSILFAGIGRTIVVLLLACMLMFLVVRSADFCRAVADCLKNFVFWIVPPFSPGIRTISFVVPSIPGTPTLAPLFQRPPPLFS